MPRFLIRKECLAQVIFEYIVDAESDDEAVEKINEEELQAYRLQMDEVTTWQMSKDILDVREIKNDGETTPEFWDCECEKDYVHSKTEPICDVCGTLSTDQPDSRLYEIPQPPRRGENYD
jgi:hypothetical protein|tara:strand:- start:125 stop:484 length:360 start_codon:yes stop_codon:yes gene_type:complete